MQKFKAALNSRNPFQAKTELADSGNTSLLPYERLMHFSELYRNQLRSVTALPASLMDASGNSLDGSGNATIDTTAIANANVKDRKKASVLYFVWHLMEILYIAPQVTAPVSDTSSHILADNLIQWLHNSDTEKSTLSEIDEVFLDPSPSSHPVYWTVISDCLAKGHLNRVARLLVKHHDFIDFEGNPYAEVVKHLRRRPRCSNKMMIEAFRHAWLEWHSELKILTATVSSDPRLRAICAVISGDLPLILKTSSNWISTLIVYIYYSRPYITSVEQVHEVYSQFESLGTINEAAFDATQTLIKELLSGNVAQFINKVESIDTWFPLHALDILRFAAPESLPINALDHAASYTLRESYIMGYAQPLCASPLFWRIGVDYLSYAENIGLAMIERVLPRVHVWSSLGLDYDTVSSILQVCDNLQLSDLKRSICRTVGKALENKRDFSAAISFYVQGGADSRIRRLVEDLVKLAAMGKIYQDVIGSLPVDVKRQDEIQLLVKYYEFRELVSTGNIKSAARMLVVMMKTSCPLRFVPQLLVDVAGMLQQDAVFSESEVYTFMECLEAVMGSHRKEEYLGLVVAGGIVKEGEAEVDKARLALSTALSKAIVSDS